MQYNGIIKRQTYIVVLAILGLVILLAGFSYALYTQSNSSKQNQVIVAGNLSVDFAESGSTITADMIPLSDSDALKKDDNLYTFTIKNNGTLNAKYSITLQNNLDGIDDPDNMLEHQYIRISVDGGEPFTLANKENVSDSDNENDLEKLVATNYTIGVTEDKEHTIRVWIDENAPMSIIGKNISLSIEITGEVSASWEDLCTEESTTLNCQILAANGGKSAIIDKGTPNFDNIATTNEGVFAIGDNNGTGYYYRGAVTNNYVLFNNDYYRIVRVNGDGSIKLIYQGPTASSNGIIATSSYSDVQGTNAFIYGNSYIKTKLNDYYQGVNDFANITNRLVDAEDKIADSLFINDRAIQLNEQKTTYYKGNKRFESLNPTLLKSSEESSNITSKIGILSMDEIILAGGGAANTEFYLHTGQAIYTMTPDTFYEPISNIFVLSSSGEITSISAAETAGVRPVISLKSNVTYTCDSGSSCGTAENPYIIN